MKRNMKLSVLFLVVTLATAALLWLRVGFAQTQNPTASSQEAKADTAPQKLRSREEIYALLDSVTQLGNKVKQVTAQKEPKWKLTQNELIGETFCQTWKQNGRSVKVNIEESYSVEEATTLFRGWVNTGSSLGRGTRFEGLGDEAAHNCYYLPRLKGCAVQVRKGKVQFTFIVKPTNMAADLDLKPLLETAKRFASHALTVDDPAMKAQN
jgi:hypothetical protein